MRRILVPIALVAALLAAATPVARAGSADVAALQVALSARGFYSGPVDGVQGAGTARALRALQRHAGLVVDGVAGPASRRALGRRGWPRLGSRVLRPGDRGWDVAALQFQLERAGFPNSTVDGGFGAHVEAALRRFQRWAGLTPDGRAGPATLRALRRRPPRSPLLLMRPVSAPVGDVFGPRGHGFHPGYDYLSPYGAPVHAAGRGCVASAGWDPGGYGNLVVLRHRLGLVSMYAHLSSFAVHAGQCVSAGQLLGRVGATGYAFGPHLHFELRLHGAAVDPATAGLSP